jgi:hypothetical protein
MSEAQSTTPVVKEDFSRLADVHVCSQRDLEGQWTENSSPTSKLSNNAGYEEATRSRTDGWFYRIVLAERRVAVN